MKLILAVLLLISTLAQATTVGVIVQANTQRNLPQGPSTTFSEVQILAVQPITKEIGIAGRFVAVRSYAQPSSSFLVEGVIRYDLGWVYAGAGYGENYPTGRGSKNYVTEHIGFRYPLGERWTLGVEGNDQQAKAADRYSFQTYKYTLSYALTKDQKVISQYVRRQGDLISDGINVGYLVTF